MHECNVVTPNLVSLGLGTLEVPERVRAEAHLGGCSSCASYFAGVEAALDAKRAARRSRAPWGAPVRRPWRLRKGRAALAGTALLGLAVALTFGGDPEPVAVGVLKVIYAAPSPAPDPAPPPADATHVELLSLIHI